MSLQSYNRTDPLLHHVVRSSVKRLAKLKAESEQLLNSWLNRKCDELSDTVTKSILSAVLSKTKTLPKIIIDSDAFVILFGGQGFKALREVKDMFHGELKPIIKAFAKILSFQWSTIAEKYPAAVWNFQYGTNILKWIEAMDSQPPDWYMYSAPIAYPLTLLSQFVRYLDFLIRHGYTQEDMVPLINGSSGHSQGIMCAVLISSSTNTRELVSRFSKFLRIAAYQGFRAHTCLSLAGGLKEYINTNVMVSHMLSVAGLTRSQLESRLDPSSNIEIIIKNDEKLFVLSGPEKELTHFVSQNKSKVYTSFLKVGGVFHTTLYQEIIPDLLDDVRSIGLTVDKNCLQFAVYSTESGQDLRIYSSDNFIRHLLELQLTKFLDFTRLITNMVSVENTCILDFGPGAGSANLCRNLLANNENIKTYRIVTLSATLKRIAYKDGTFFGGDILKDTEI